MAGSNFVNKVAIVGAGGNCGSFMTDALLKTGKHTVTAITRANSQNKLPKDVIVKEVDYDKPETLVEALRGQDALLITLSVFTPQGTQMKLINAAAEAGVPWIFPNEWGVDTENEALVRDVAAFQSYVATRKAIKDLGKSSYIAVSTGFWYEWSLAMPEGFGFDLLNQKVTLYDDGDTKTCISTWPQVGRMIAALLRLPIKSEGSNKEVCLEYFRNKKVYVNSFTISQKDMLDSVLRVTGTEKDNWKITKEASYDRYARGNREMKEGKHSGFPTMMYSRVFYPDGVGNFEHKGLLNEMLGLPKEDIDEATKAAIERAKSSNGTV